MTLAVPVTAPTTASGRMATIQAEEGLFVWTTNTSSQAREARIVRTPGICGGRARIAGTRIPVWGLEASRRQGNSDTDIIEMYPAVTQADLQAAWRYVNNHAQKIQVEIDDNEV